MVRVGGLQYSCSPNEKMGRRIQDMQLKGRAIEPKKMYKVAGWAPVAADAKGEMVWDVLETWLKDKKRISPRKLNTPKLIGMKGNPGLGG